MTRRIAWLAALALLAAGCGGDDDTTAADAPAELVGLFRITAGACTPDGATGATFRMVQPGGTVDDGPFVTNGDSACDDKTWTPLAPGTDGGLRTGAYQPQLEPPFDGAGNSASAVITEPEPWFAVAFGLATNQRDPQTGSDAAEPTITRDGTILTGDLGALAASWNGQHFNQGAPKPDGGLPGATTAPTGTYDEATGAYSLDWTSQIVGGPFNNFAGVWHLEGVFEPD